MRMWRWSILFLLLGVLSQPVFSAQWYVSASSGNDIFPGTGWTHSKRTIQGAIDIAGEGDLILVDDGSYAPIFSSNKAVEIRSMNGAWATYIDGGGISNCAYLGAGIHQTNTVLIGFTLCNGFSETYGGGSYYGTLRDCIITDCTAEEGGGGAYGSVLENCFISHNVASEGGGSRFGVLSRCSIWMNEGDMGGGVSFGRLYDCLLNENWATLGGGADRSLLWGCTVVNNGAGEIAGGVRKSAIANSIIYENLQQDDELGNYEESYLVYTCTQPLPSSGVGNIATDPLFVSGDDFRLLEISECVDAGEDMFLANLHDLDGNARLQGARVDMGAFESKPAWFVDSAGEDSNSGRQFGDALCTIQRAVNLALEGDTIWVADGVYAPFSSGNKRVTIRSAGATHGAVIDGGNSVRCATLGTSITHTNTVLIGFTIRNGRATDGAGTYGGTIYNCHYENNIASYRGGGAYGGIIYNSYFTGGSAYLGGGSCDNEAHYCIYQGNSASGYGGGTFNTTLLNSLVEENSAWTGGGVIASAEHPVINSTIVNNTAYRGGGLHDGVAINSIIWGNSADCVNEENYSYDTILYITNSCTYPLPATGTNNMDQDPLFVSFETRQYGLQSNSPCLDAGDMDYAFGEVDLAGNARVQNGVVDLGAFEGVGEYIEMLSSPPMQTQALQQGDALTISTTTTNLDVGIVSTNLAILARNALMRQETGRYGLGELIDVRTSEEEWQPHSGWLAVDGDAATAWIGRAGGALWWLMLVYGGDIDVVGVQVKMASGDSADMRILYSGDALAWEEFTPSLLPVSLSYLWLIFDNPDGTPPGISEIIVDRN